MTFRMAGDTKPVLSIELLNQVEQSLTWISTLSLTTNIVMSHFTMVNLHIFQVKSVDKWQYKGHKETYFWDCLVYILDILCK